MIDTIARKIAWMLPKKIVMWAYYRVLAYATSGKWGHEYVDDLSPMTVIKRWDGEE